MKNIALILASGTGSRFGLDIPKQFAKVNGKTILQYTVEKFQYNQYIDDIILVTNPQYIKTVTDLVKNYTKVKDIIFGGATRKDSSYNGINTIKDPEANILIHDGVRPLVSDEIITSCIDKLNSHDAVCVTIPSTDTVFETDENEFITNIPMRKFIKRAQTPQCFKLSIIRKAHNLAQNDKNCFVTDDCGLVMHYNLAKIKTINGSVNNIKITYPEDLEFAKNLL